MAMCKHKKEIDFQRLEHLMGSLESSHCSVQSHKFMGITKYS
jgi:hypothetical protein